MSSAVSSSSDELQVIDPDQPPADPYLAEARERRMNRLWWAVTILCAAALFGGILWMGAKTFFVRTNSMVPTLNPTDMVLVVDPERVNVGVGTIIVFAPQFGSQQLEPHVHRIVGKDQRGWITKGDNTSKPDPWRVPDADVQGVVVSRIPTWLGRSPIVIGIGIFVVLILLFWPGRKEDSEAEPEPSAGSPDD